MGIFELLGVLFENLLKVQVCLPPEYEKITPKVFIHVFDENATRSPVHDVVGGMIEDHNINRNTQDAFQFPSKFNIVKEVT